MLYGQSTPGGLVNMVSKRPTASPLREVELQTGNRGRVQGSFDVSDRIDPAGRVLYRVTGVAYRHDAETDIADGKRRFAIAPSLTFRPNDRTSLTLMARYQNDDFGGSPLNWLPAYGTVLPNANGKLGRDLYTGDPNFERWKRESANIGYALEHRFDDTFTFRQNFRYLHNKLDHAGLYVSTLQADQRTANRQAFGMIEHSDDFTLDNQVEARFSTGPLQHTLLFGIDGQWFLDDTDRVLQSPAATLDLFNPVYGVAINATPTRRARAKGGSTASTSRTRWPSIGCGWCWACARTGRKANRPTS